LNLGDPVLFRYHRKNGLIVGSGEKLDLAAAYHGSHVVHKVRMMFAEPSEQRAGVVLGTPDPRMFLQDVQERCIAGAIRLLKNGLEVSYRLVVVDGKDKVDGVHVLWVGIVPGQAVP
jgi:hypothetical protein